MLIKMVYAPAEDSYLLEEQVISYLSSLSKEKRSKIKILDMGSGSGIQAKACIKQGIHKENLLCVDIDKKAIQELKKQNLQVKLSNLFSKSNKKEKFDLIIFNPPYLPEDKYDKEADTTAGKKGYETILKFLKQAKSHLEDKGVILLLFSSLSHPEIIKEKAKQQGYNFQELAKQGVGMFETLYVYEFWV